jgi:hypothetical protein
LEVNVEEVENICEEVTQIILQPLVLLLMHHHFQDHLLNHIIGLAVGLEEDTEKVVKLVDIKIYFKNI